MTREKKKRETKGAKLLDHGSLYPSSSVDLLSESTLKAVFKLSILHYVSPGSKFITSYVDF